jgi:RNAse (barnase) inhibitor barstar
MRWIELDGGSWTTALDFYTALLGALGAPKGHGRNINALIDSMIWGGMNAVEPPYTIRIRGIGNSDYREGD